MGMTALVAMWASVLVALWVQSQACLVQDCPEGGKRAAPDTGRQCTSCGPGNSGQCVSSIICCGDSFGCFLGTQETAVCQDQNDVHTPCAVSGDICASVAGGRCVSNGFCCSPTSCSFDLMCNTAATQRELKDRLKERLLDVLLSQP